jgi:Holliday junction resolvase RusA-like endonuclease
MTDDTDALMLFIDYDFISWNDYIRAERGNLYQANAIKQNEKQFIAWTVKGKYTGNYPVTLTIKPYFKDKRRDLDNYRLKGLIDGLVTAGVIRNDNLHCINKIIIEPIFEDRRGVWVEIRETLKED